MSDNEIKTVSVYNKNNSLIQKKDIIAMLKKGNSRNRIKDLSIWQRAFVHKSYSKNTKKKNKYTTYDPNDNANGEYIEIKERSNERLEWLGDGIIQAVMADYLWNKYEYQDEGFLTKTRSKLVKTKTLSQLAIFLGMQPFIMMSQYVEEECKGRNNARILEDTFEAFIGAMYIDFSRKDKGKGFNVSRDYIINVMEQVVNIEEIIKEDTNYKDQLMRYYQKTFDGAYPKYYENNTNYVNNYQSNYSHNKKFHMYVKSPKGKIIGKGFGKSKKEAEQYAARAALKYYKVLNKM